jgi:uncharacterized membrane protein YhhN
MRSETILYVLKPLILVAIIASAVRARPTISSRYRVLIVVGLGWSLAGDVLLMLPQDLFVHGLATFLVAHLCYITAFARTGGGLRDPVAGLGVAVVAGGMLAFLWPSLGALRAPVTAYVAVIATMAWQAIARWRHLRSADALAAATGATLFLVSDGALAIRRFRGEFEGASLLVLGTYWLAQVLIARSVRAE